MEKIYNQISEKTKLLIEIVASCKNDSEKTLKLSDKLLSIMDSIKSLCKRLEGSITEEIDVLEKKLSIFLENSSNSQISADIKEITQRIIEEASSY